MRKPLIIGQAPGPNTDPAVPLGGRSGQRLAELCGLDLDVFLRAFERVNLLESYPGKAGNGKGDAFPIGSAREKAIDILLRYELHERMTIMLGDNVCRTFGLAFAMPCYFYRSKVMDAAVAFCPHPSGICRWWNEPANVKKARRFWRKIGQEAARGL